jgi:hypothetical protein
MSPKIPGIFFPEYLDYFFDFDLGSLPQSFGLTLPSV